MTDALRTAAKDVVKEAVREVQREAAEGTTRQRRQALVYVGVGAALGYFAAKRGSRPAEREPLTGESETAVEIQPGSEAG